MSLNRAAHRTVPRLLRNPAYAHLLSANARRIPSRITVPAIALLIPHGARLLSTDTSTGGGGGSGGPPPGFNLDKAKRPLPKDTEKKAADAEKAVGLDINVPKDAATAIPKGEAVESQSLSELATQKAASKGETTVAKKDEKKLTVWQKVKKEAAHYWDGTKLLATEVRISFKLALKMAAGYELTRREHRQLQRTVQDLGRLVPFSVFVIVPFAELLLPVALRLFPNLLPSTYESAKEREAKATKLRSSRKEVSSFLRQTMRETGLPVSIQTSKKEEFTDFFKKVRSTGENPTPADVIKVCKLFKDDLTLDNLSRPQLVGICRYMNLNTVGPDTILRYQIRHRMRQIKRDDKAIAYEGVDSLSVPELQMAAASRGLRTQGVSPGRLRDDLQMWLDLRLKYGVPSTLLVLSNAFMYSTNSKDSASGESEFSSQIEALGAVLSSIPEELFHEIELEVHTAEGAATNKQRLEVLKEQEELIQEENEQTKSSSGDGGEKSAAPKDNQNIDEEELRAEREKALGEEMKEAEDEGIKAKGEEQGLSEVKIEAKEATTSKDKSSA